MLYYWTKIISRKQNSDNSALNVKFSERESNYGTNRVYFQKNSWYRIAGVNFNNEVASSLAGGLIGLLMISRGFANNNGESYTLSLNGSYHAANITTLSSCIGQQLIDKIRIVRKGNSAFLDVHYTSDNRNDADVFLFAQTGGTFWYRIEYGINVTDDDYDIIISTVTL